MWKIHDVKTKGREAFKANYWLGVLVVFLMAIIGFGVDGVFASTVVFDHSSMAATRFSYHFNQFISTMSVGSLIGIAVTIVVAALIIIGIACAFLFCVTIPFYVGSSKYFIEANNGKADAGDLMVAYKKGNFGSVIRSIFLQDLFIALWSLLFVIPGIIKAYQWRLVPYIMAENPTMKAKDARDLSKKLMYGHKWHSFGFDLSFIWWHILSCLTFGILYAFWTLPFCAHAEAALYQTLKALNEKKPALKAETKPAEVKAVEVKKTPEATPAVAKLEAKKAEAKKPVAKKAPAKKAPAKKAEVKKAEVKPAVKQEPAKKAEVKPVEVKKTPEATPTVAKAEVKKAEVKKPVANKAPSKKPEAKKAEAKPAAKKAPAKKTEAKKTEVKPVEVKKAPEAKKPAAKKAPVKKTEAKKAEVKPVAKKTAKKATK